MQHEKDRAEIWSDVEGSGFAREDNGEFFRDRVTFFHGQRGFFLFERQRRVFHRVFFRTFERITIVTICKGHRSERTVIRGI